MGTMRPIRTDGDFGRSPFFGQLFQQAVLGSSDTARLVKDFLSALRQPG
jgi:hypothetical protein